MEKERSVWAGILLTAGFMIYGLYCAIASNITMNLNQMTADDFKSGRYVKGTVNGNLGVFCQEESYRGFVQMGSTNYYLIPYGEDNDRFVALKTSEHGEELAKLLEDTYSYLTGEKDALNGTLEIKGLLYKCDAEEIRYMDEFLEGSDIRHVDYFILETGFMENYLPLCLAFAFLILTVVMKLKVEKDQG